MGDFKHLNTEVDIDVEHLDLTALAQIPSIRIWEIKDSETLYHFPKDTQPVNSRNQVFWLQDQCSFPYIMPIELIPNPSFMLPEAVLVISYCKGCSKILKAKVVIYFKIL